MILIKDNICIICNRYDSNETKEGSKSCNNPNCHYKYIDKFGKFKINNEKKRMKIIMKKRRMKIMKKRIKNKEIKIKLTKIHSLKMMNFDKILKNGSIDTSNIIKIEKIKSEDNVKYSNNININEMSNNGLDGWECPYCDKCFLSEHITEEHILSIHTVEMNYKKENLDSVDKIDYKDRIIDTSSIPFDDDTQITINNINNNFNHDLNNNQNSDDQSDSEIDDLIISNDTTNELNNMNEINEINKMNEINEMNDYVESEISEINSIVSNKKHNINDHDKKESNIKLHTN